MPLVQRMWAVALALCCGAGCDGPTSAQSPTRGLPARSSAVDLAAKTRVGVCACEDLECADKLIADVGETLPALLEDATAEDRRKVIDHREAALDCRDKLREIALARPAHAVTAFATAVCACTKSACATEELAAQRSMLEAANEANMTLESTDEIFAARAKVTGCLEALAYEGTSVPDFAEQAEAAVARSCACADDACGETSIKALAHLKANAITPDDERIVRDMMTRATNCSDEHGATAAHSRKP